MAEQPALTERIDPWQEERAKSPGCILLRRIDCERALQFWIRIERTPKNLELGAELWDEATFITPARPGDDVEAKAAREAIIAAYDAEYTSEALAEAVA